MLRNGSWIMHRGRTWDWDAGPSQRAWVEIPRVDEPTATP